ncbi:hypothetical protein A0H81_14120 [Grifola frondosa]|uniref:Uncharacterized protein n=1 Tax=Grifola frondosa TaxID=5627 RepID=A0A1C7LM74_GRIFR|nr:hypothetical protein A0H81_14120 [Grifola frondosa]
MTGTLFDDPPCQFTGNERDTLRIDRERIYIHKVVRINYTTYDMRCAQDSINPTSHPDVLLLSSPDDPHPFAYARVLSVFHVNAYRVGPGLPEHPELERIEVLWARSFEVDESAPGGFDAKRLHRLKFVDCNDEAAFVLLDPQQVVRGAHLIPAFHHSRTDEYLPGFSLARREEETDDQDWKYFYVGM